MLIQKGQIMRIFPDKDYEIYYKANYDENYKKLTAFRKRTDSIVIDLLSHPERIKTGLLGAIVIGVIFAAILCSGAFISGSYTEKETQIASLKATSSELDEKIQAYQVFDSDTKYEQIDEAIAQIVDLQTQYATNDFGDTFDVYAERYLGSYNENWADGLVFKGTPVWVGYYDKADSNTDSIDMVFVLCDGSIPVMVAKTSYSIDKYGNLVELIRLETDILT